MRRTKIRMHFQKFGFENEFERLIPDSFIPSKESTFPQIQMDILRIREACTAKD